MRYEIHEKLFKIKTRFHKYPKHIYCHRCLREIDKSKETFYMDYDIQKKKYEYLCEKCNKFFEEQIEERDRNFKEKCPLHKSCCLWCSNCEAKENCYENL